MKKVPIDDENVEIAMQDSTSDEDNYFEKLVENETLELEQDIEAENSTISETNYFKLFH